MSDNLGEGSRSVGGGDDVSLDQALKRTDEALDRLERAWGSFRQARGAKPVGSALIMCAVMHRAYLLLQGIKLLFLHDCFHVAAMLLRPLLDTLCVLAVLKNQREPERLANDLFAISKDAEGETVFARMDKLKDDDGKCLTDARMREHAVNVFPEIQGIYDEWSKFIHFSWLHFHDLTGRILRRGEAGGIGVESSDWQDSEKRDLALWACSIGNYVAAGIEECV